MGLDLLKGITRNNLEAGVIEPAMSKVKIIQVFCFSRFSFFWFWQLHSYRFPISMGRNPNW
jgi:hypothetical protein